MSNQTQLNSKKIKEKLLDEQNKLEADLKSLKEDDPVLDSLVSESSEPGTDSWMADVHSRAMAARGSLEGMLKNIKKALRALNTGKYGKCEDCGKQIEAERLEAMPTAVKCITCSKKASKK